jgi:hypothetical protein
MVVPHFISLPQSGRNDSHCGSLIHLTLRRYRQLDTLRLAFSNQRPAWSDRMRNLSTAAGIARAVGSAVSLLAAIVLTPAVAHADPMGDYVSRSGKAVCAELDKVQDGGDFFRLTLTVAHDGKFSIKDAADVIEQSAIADCPWQQQKVKQAGKSAPAPPTSQPGLPAQ